MPRNISKVRPEHRTYLVTETKNSCPYNPGVIWWTTEITYQESAKIPSLVCSKFNFRYFRTLALYYLTNRETYATRNEFDFHGNVPHSNCYSQSAPIILPSRPSWLVYYCLQAVIGSVWKDFSLFKSAQVFFPVTPLPWYRVVRCVSREDKPYKEQSLRRTGFSAGGVSSLLKMASLNLCKTVHWNIKRVNGHHFKRWASYSPSCCTP